MRVGISTLYAGAPGHDASQGIDQVLDVENARAEVKVEAGTSSIGRGFGDEGSQLERRHFATRVFRSDGRNNARGDRTGRGRPGVGSTGAEGFRAKEVREGCIVRLLGGEPARALRGVPDALLVRV